jgi:hypothetical protein
MMIFGTAPPIPALNKWLKIFPPISYFIVGKLAHGVFDHCLKVVLGSTPAQLAGRAARPMSVDEFVGIGDSDTFMRAQAVRKSKALVFLQRPITQRKLCVAALCCKVIMSFMGLVFRLAKQSHGRCHSDHIPDIVPFCNMEHSPVVRTIQHMLNLLQTPAHEFWLPLTGGRAWDFDSAHDAFNAMLTATGHMFLLCVMPWCSWPWKWCALVDDSLTPERRYQCAVQLFRLKGKECCTDIGFTQKLLKDVHSVEGLLCDRVRQQVVGPKPIPPPFFLHRG